MAIYHFSGVFYLFFSKKNDLKIKHLKKYPKVDVLFTFFNEDINTLFNNLKKAKKLNYPNFNVVLLDDSNKNNKKIENFCKKNNIMHVKRKTNRGFKAGNLNDYINKYSPKYIAIIDADEEIFNFNFLLDTMSLLILNDYSYVQTIKGLKQGNTVLSKTISRSFSFFFEDLSVSASKYGFSMFLGSCAVFNVKDIKKIKGFPENHLVEDTAISIKLDAKKRSGYYFGKKYIIGSAIKNYVSFEKQQYRYDFGNTALFPEYLKIFNFKDINFKDIQYLIHFFGLHYMSFSILFSTIFLILSVFLNQDFVVLSILIFLQMPLSSIISSIAFYKDFLFGFYVYILNHSISLVRILSFFDVLKNKSKEFYEISRNEILEFFVFLICIFATFFSNNLFVQFFLILSSFFYFLPIILRRTT